MKLILCLLFPCLMQAQPGTLLPANVASTPAVVDQPKFKLKPHIAPAISVFVAGMAEGTMDVLDFKYWKFKRVFPGANDQFWNPEISWQNRLGEYFPFTRDGWHLAKFVNHLGYGVTIVLHPNDKKRWYWYIVDGIAYWMINRAGFHLTYNLIFK